MKKILVVIFLIMSLTITYSQISGDINQDATWSGTVNITGNVTVKSGATLTVKPGTEVVFTGYYRLTIEGTVKAIGNADNFIIFAPESSTNWDNFSVTDGGWQGIRIKSTSSKLNEFKNCWFAFGKALDIPEAEDDGGGMKVYWIDNVLIDSCIFYMNYAEFGGGGLACPGSDIKIRNTIFYGNIAGKRGGAIQMNNASPHIDACLFSNNEAYEVGGAIKTQNSFALLTNNIIVNNEATYSGGAFLFTSGANPVLVNNTICNNKASAGGAVLMYNQSYPVFINNIIYGNEDGSGTNQFEFEGLTPEPELVYNNIQGGFAGIGFEPGASFGGIYENNIDEIPDFNSPTSAAGVSEDGSSYTSWKLNMGSPCINAGLNNTGKITIETDYENKERTSFSIVDLGALEYVNDEYTLEGTISSDLIITADTIFVVDDVMVSSGTTLGINAGTYVKFMGYYEINVYGTLLSLGTKNDNVIYSVNDTTGFSNFSSNTGGWGGIRFWTTSATNDSSKFIHSTFRYGKAVSGSNTSGGGLSVGFYNKVLIDHCTFEHNVANVAGALRLHAAPIKVRYCVFRYNTANNRGGAVESLLSNPYIENCLFEYNTAGNEGGAINLLDGKSRIFNNIIRHNTSHGIGGGLHSEDSYPEISGNIVTFNTASSSGGGMNFFASAYISKNFMANNTSGSNGGGIYGSFNNNSVLTNNIIVNNSANKGGGLYISNKKPEFVNNTIAFNYAGNQGGGIMLSGISPSLYNSILWGNKAGTQCSQLDFNFQSQPSLLFCNIEGGRDSIETIADNSIDQYVNNIDSLPVFFKPSGGAGTDFDGTVALWGLKATSPCINMGTISTAGLEVLNSDIRGNPRINYERIDIGARENQGTDPVILRHPANLFKCEGNRIMFNVNVSDTVYYQWQLEGENIPGATSNKLIIDSVTLDDQGTYICKIWNAYGQIESNPALLNTIVPPSIWQEPKGGWVKKRDVTILEFGHRGTEPLQYKWFKNGNAIPGTNFPKLRFDNTSLENEGNYYCKIVNTCGTVQTEEITLYVAPEICMVTVDTTEGDNLVVWEKETSAPINHFNVYREGIIAGKYDLLGSVNSDSLSVFVDEEANPLKQAYFYKLTAVDTAGKESDIDLCDPHKTIHLIVTLNPETKAAQLDWDEYLGFPYGTYNIYRSIGCNNFTLFDQIASSSTAWTDTDPQEGWVCYRVGVERPVECLSGGSLKAGAGPYSHALSNTDDNRLQTGGTASIYRNPGTIVVYPNPFTDHTTIRFANPENKKYGMVIRDLSGKVVRTEGTIYSDEFLLYKEDLNPGYYIIELKGARFFRGKIVVK